MILTLLLIALGVIFLVYVLCKLFSHPSSQLYIADSPTHRSLHTVAVSRAGGVALVIPIFASWVIAILFLDANVNFIGVLAGFSLLIVISYLDDKLVISPLLRLLVHVFAAYILVEVGLNMFAGWGKVFDIIIKLAVILLIVWSINTYNFMDGIDGLAGGMGVMGFSCLAWHGWAHGNYIYMYLAIGIVAANIGFLLHNFPPARIFMGDTGSIAMGYTASFFSIWGVNDGMFAWWVPVLIFSPFLVDSTITLIKRLIRGDRVWEAHRSHYYQKLVLYGWSHGKTVITEYTVSYTHLTLPTILLV